MPGLAAALAVRSVSRAHRHTLAHTGLMLWDSAPVLARALLRRPALLAGVHGTDCTRYVRASPNSATPCRRHNQRPRGCCSVRQVQVPACAHTGCQEGVIGPCNCAQHAVASREEGAGGGLWQQPARGLCSAAPLPAGGLHRWQCKGPGADGRQHSLQCQVLARLGKEHPPCCELLIATDLQEACPCLAQAAAW